MIKRFAVMSALLLVLGLLLACAPAPAQPPAAPAQATSAPTAPTSAGSPAGFDWQRFKGSTVRILISSNTSDDYWIKQFPEFEKLTGIKVNYDKMTIAEVYPKTLLELTTNPDKVDAYLFYPHQQGYKFLKEGFQADLMPFVNDPTLTSPDYDFADFFESQIQGLTKDGKLIGIPWSAYTELLTYRKDLYAEKGLKAPETFAELEENVIAFHDPSKELYGLVTRGRGSEAVHMWAEWNWNFGGDWLDKEGKPIINQPNSIAAFQEYGKLLGKYGPPGPTNLTDGDMLALFCQGKAVHFMNSATFGFTFSDTTKCPAVAGKIGWTLYPKGPTGLQVTHSMPLSLSISSQSPNKEAAWYLIQWLTNKQNTLALQLMGYLSPRKSVWQDPQVIDGQAKAFPEWVEKATLAMSKGRPDGLPPAEDVQAARDAIGKVITVAIEGGDVQAAADAANAEYSKLLGFAP